MWENSFWHLKIPKIQSLSIFPIYFPWLFMFSTVKEKWATILLQNTTSSLLSKTLFSHFSLWNSILSSGSISMIFSFTILLTWSKDVLLNSYNASNFSCGIYFLLCILWPHIYHPVSTTKRCSSLAKNWLLYIHCTL